MHAVRMSLKYTFKVFLPLLNYCPAPGKSSPGFVGLRTSSVSSVLLVVRFIAVANGTAYRGCTRWLCETVRGLSDSLLVSSSVDTLSSRALLLHMQKPLADAPARVGGEGTSVGAHNPMVGDDHGKRVFPHCGPHGAV